MTENGRLKLMCVFAHPDDESLGVGSVLARYAAEGVEITLVTATRGEHGWQSAGPGPGPQALGEMREGELRAAAATLGLHEVCLLDYIDGTLDAAPPERITAQIVAHVRRVRPQVVLTFGMDGVYGHPDHIAISQFTSAALQCAANAAYVGEGPAHSVSKLYHLYEDIVAIRRLEEHMGGLCIPVDGVPRCAFGLPEWAITTRVAAGVHWRTGLQAALCHVTQKPSFEEMLQLSEAELEAVWAERGFYRAFSLVNGGRALERDLFAGLR